MDDITCIILSKLNLKDLLDIRATNKYYHNIVSNKKLNTIFYHTINSKDVKAFSQINNRRGIANISYQLIIEGVCNFSPINLKNIPNIDSLILTNKSISGNYVRELTNLKSLSLCGHNAASLKFFRYLTNLTHLGFYNNYSIISDNLPYLSQLTSLKFHNSYTSGENIKSLTRLNKLSLSRSNDMRMNIDDHIIMCLTGLTSLKFKGHCQITEKGIRHLTNLRTLYVDKNKKFNLDGIFIPSSIM